MPEPASDSPVLSITLLGAGQEVGRSCCVLRYRGKTVVCDCGIHPAFSGMASLPFIDELDWSTVDVILVTHFHLDHAAALTYITEKTNFRDGHGKIYMTHPTKAVYKYMMQDFVKMSDGAEALFTPLELSMSMNSIIPVSAHQQIAPFPGVSFTPYHAGHVLGACMFLIDVYGLKILYTGDYSREEDRHLVKAEIPPVRPDVLIVESTYGVQSVEGRDEKELRFTSMVHTIIKRGGHVLLPTFALGRAQELLLILDEYWSKHPELHNVPVYYASSLARKCMAVYQTYIYTMNANIRKRFDRRDNPFVFKFVSHMPQSKNWERKIAEGPPCVVLASPGFMQSGTSRQFLELWAPDPRNGVIITGYSVEGTMARDIVNEPDEITARDGRTIPRRLSVEEVSFSAHVDFSQNAEFIELVKARQIVLVHGELTAMARLRSAIQARFNERDEDVKIHAPRNLEELQLNFRGERVAKAIGALAQRPPKGNTHLSGLLVAKDFSYTLLDPRDLRDFTGLSTSAVVQKMNLYLGVGLELVRWHLEGMYGGVEEGMDENGYQMFRVMGAVDVKHTAEHEITLEWNSSASNDMIADSVMAVIVGIERSPASVKVSSHHDHSHHEATYDQPHPHADIPGDDNIVERRALRTQKIADFLEAHFGDVETVETRTGDDGKLILDPAMVVRIDKWEARIGLLDLTVTSSNHALKTRVKAVLEIAMTTVDSLTTSFSAMREGQNAITLGGTDKKVIGNTTPSIFEVEGPSEDPQSLAEPLVGEATTADGDRKVADTAEDASMDDVDIKPMHELDASV
ncbi:beta-lactamase-like protein [Cantharellus anzutake]|uniref:beta-lactamase-like protein n=1 Tax=Cantharellus anzutake TaxID=1750568 RepID=UPI001903290C|nr:beta-lactamase-like protein [Cantharellus anzutake]KAF8335755.1 beta-lactamase-like protein [Cantharellus anzutake]